MRRELLIKDREYYENVVNEFKDKLDLDVPVKLSPFKHRSMIAYYDWKEHKMVIFVHNTTSKLDFVQVLAHEMAHVLDIKQREKSKKWRNHHDINFFIKYYDLLLSHFNGELPSEVWVEFLNELDTFEISLDNFRYYHSKSKEKAV